ncbi:EthD domain-containing protein [Bacillus sp. OK048]|uniref:EthD domain-containing protein n=1 Tax=Bacillus sp. OK048 TaxID=1882761 RepID=UPI00088F5C3E|nr:EthD domain-containing protein [Bacillus sp. OK048]SDL97795.1 conserved hypothetical protein [Bacillus sp. OK048]
MKTVSAINLELIKQYYALDHAKLVSECAEAMRMRRYILSHTLQGNNNIFLQSRDEEVTSYDGIAEVWWDSLEELNMALATPEGRAANKLLKEDESKFVDLSKTKFFFTEEHTII